MQRRKHCPEPGGNPPFGNTGFRADGSWEENGLDVANGLHIRCGRWKRRRSWQARIILWHYRNPGCWREFVKPHLLEDGYDIRTVHGLLGHADVSTTMI